MYCVNSSGSCPNRVSCTGLKESRCCCILEVLNRAQRDLAGGLNKNKGTVLWQSWTTTPEERTAGYSTTCCPFVTDAAVMLAMMRATLTTMLSVEGVSITDTTNLKVFSCRGKYKLYNHGIILTYWVDNDDLSRIVKHQFLVQLQMMMILLAKSSTEKAHFNNITLALWMSSGCSAGVQLGRTPGKRPGTDISLLASAWSTFRKLEQSLMLLSRTSCSWWVTKSVGP